MGLHYFLYALKNSLLPGGPGSFSILKPASFNDLFTFPLHEYVVKSEKFSDKFIVLPIIS